MGDDIDGDETGDKSDPTLPRQLDDETLADVSGGIGGNIPNAPPRPITVSKTPPASRPGFSGGVDDD